jgi:hypothetical protein
MNVRILLTVALISVLCGERASAGVITPNDPSFDDNTTFTVGISYDNKINRYNETTVKINDGGRVFYTKVDGKTVLVHESRANNSGFKQLTKISSDNARTNVVYKVNPGEVIPLAPQTQPAGTKIQLSNQEFNFFDRTTQNLGETIGKENYDVSINQKIGNDIVSKLGYSGNVYAGIAARTGSVGMSTDTKGSVAASLAVNKDVALFAEYNQELRGGAQLRFGNSVLEVKVGNTTSSFGISQTF